MKVEIKGIRDPTFTDLFLPCRSCIYWEAPGHFDRDEHGRLKLAEEESIAIKREWFREVNGQFGCCGMILYVEGEAVGYAQYAPAHLLPNVTEYTLLMSSPGPDAVLISCLYIKQERQKQGLGKRLLQAVLESSMERGYHAAETYSRDDSVDNCSGPTEFYLKNGFMLIETKKWEQASFSLMRFEFSSRVSRLASYPFSYHL